MIVDGLIFLGTSHFGYALDAASAVAHMDAVETAVAIAAPMHPRGAVFDAVNTAVINAARNSAGRLVALARVDPWEGDAAIAGLKRAFLEGARGVFLHPSEEHFRINHKMVQPVVECAAEFGAPIVVAAGYHLYSEPLQLGDVARRAPNVPIVLTNGGQLNTSGREQFNVEIALRNSNVYLQTNGVYREDFLERVISEYGRERLIYSSADPVFDMALERRRIEFAHFDEATRELVLGGNAARLFGIELA